MVEGTLLPMLLTDAARFLLAFVILVLPGAALCLSIARKELSWPEFASISVTSGLTLNTVTLFFLSYMLKKPVVFSTVVLASFSLTLLFILFRLLSVMRSGGAVGVRRLLEVPLGEHGQFESAVLLVALVFVVLLNLGVHSQYNLPYHMDEWLHLSLSVQVMEEKGLKFVNPNYPSDAFVEPDYSPHRLEAGFHVLLASFYMVSGADPVTSVSYLPALVTALTCLNLYSLVYMLTKRFRPALYSIVFFAGLKSSISLLGPWFLVPQALGFAFIYLVFYCFEVGRQGALGMHYAGMLNLLGVALIHPQSAALLYLALTIYAAATSVKALIALSRKSAGPFKARIKEVVGEYRGFLIGAVVYLLFPLVGFAYFFKILWREDLWTTVSYFLTDFIVFKSMLEIANVYTLEYPLDHYRAASAAFFIIGFLTILLRGKHLVLTSGAVGAFADLALFHTKGFTVFMTYERLLYYCFIFMTPISGLGLWYTLDFIEKKLRRLKYAAYLGSIVLVILVAGIVQGYYTPREKLAMGLKASEYEALNWVYSYAGGGNIVLARPRVSDTIYPVSMNKVVAMTPRGKGYSAGMNALHDFFMSNCTGKKTVLADYRVGYVVDNQKLDCDFLEEIHSKDDITVYRVDIQ